MSRLTLEDLLSLKFNAESVVPSASNPAGADGCAVDARPGDFSLQEAAACCCCMGRWHRSAEAMLETMKLKAGAHPTYWAPCALAGECGR